MLGFRGHFSTKSRTYSTTLAALRADRAAHAATHDPYTQTAAANPDIIVVNHWTYAGHADTPGPTTADRLREPSGAARAAP